MRLILASSSPYRRVLLERLGLAFEQIDSQFNEAHSSTMHIAQLVEYNTMGKAATVLKQHPDGTIIASDQVAICDHQILEKPGNIANAEKQLALLSGKKATFLTGLCLISANSCQFEIIPYHVYFRSLTNSEIKRYIERDKPLDCAGSFKSEGLGITLCEKMAGDDPTALVGLPLIRLSQWLNPL
ncbi:MAG: Maf family protein [Mariprofundus sp.]|nr:Maf family protein [Mariprofundus sp.]